MTDLKDVLLNSIEKAQDNNSNKNTEMSPFMDVNDGEFFGDALNEDNINEIITNSIPKLIVFVGFAGYGKSTLVGSLYQYLLHGLDLEGYSLIDSKTFTGFERRVSLRRLSEDRLESNTKRTLRGDNYYLSLILDNEINQCEIVISDKAGEVYKEYKDNKTKAQNDPAFKRADNIILLVDSEELSKQVNRTTSSILDLIENIPFSDNSDVFVIFTKIDLVDMEDFKDISDKLIESIDGAINQPVKPYYTDSKKYPTKVGDSSSGTVVEIFNDIIKSYTKTNKNYDELNWIKSGLK